MDAQEGKEWAVRLITRLNGRHNAETIEIREMYNISVPLCEFVRDGYVELTESGIDYVLELRSVMSDKGLLTNEDLKLIEDENERKQADYFEENGWCRACGHDQLNLGGKYCVKCLHDMASSKAACG
jgi:hypothetical protein